jgi:hypothetical protein
MDKKAVTASHASIAKAASSLEALKNAKTFPQFEAAWSDFLLAAGRVFSKLEQGAKISGPSKAWYGHQKHLRRTDPLLSYIHHARNIDEHGIEQITELKPGSVGIGTTGTTQVERLRIENRPEGVTVEAKTTGDPLVVSMTPPQPRLISVIDHGDRYDPPKEHLGTPISDPSPIKIAELALSYLRSMTDEASKL